MSWPLVSFALVFAVLGGGWLAYERSRPSARMVALVGTLAGLAALGRDAFAALPDVKPITAMTFVVGYALGPLPGFSVGALGMLASNIVLGEGSYTPWQMAGWGAVGLAGAALGRIGGRRSGRLGLAVGCALSAAAAKELMNVYEWTLGASHTPAALLLMIGKGIPFDVTDVVSSFFFGLAFGPELARLLGRMRARMTVTWQPAAAAPLAALALALVAAGAAHAQRSGQLRFLRSAQNADGGFGGAPGQRSSELYSAWAALGLAAAGRDPTTLVQQGHNLLDALRGQAATVESTGDVERTILALHACRAPLRLPVGGDLASRLLAARRPDGSFEELVNITSFAVFSLRAAGRPAEDPVVRSAGAWLQEQQNPNGGFGYAARGGAGDVDDTAAALQAIVDAGGAGSATVSRAVGYLLGAVNRDGGLPQQPGADSNAQSTAWAVQALVAGGRDPGRAWHGAVRSPLAYLRSLAAADGSVRYSHASSQTPVWVTAQALTALARKPFPIQPPAPGAGEPLRHRSPPAIGGRALSAGTTAAFGRHGGKAAVKTAGGLARRLSAQAAQARLDALAHAAGALIAVLLGPLMG